MYTSRILLCTFLCLVFIICAGCGASKGSSVSLSDTVATSQDGSRQAEDIVNPPAVADSPWRMYGNDCSNSRWAEDYGAHGSGVAYTDPIYTRFDCTPVFDLYDKCYIIDIHGNIYTVDVSDPANGLGEPELLVPSRSLGYSSNRSSCLIAEQDENNLYWNCDGYLHQVTDLTLPASPSLSAFIDGYDYQNSSPVAPGTGSHTVITCSGLPNLTGSDFYMYAFHESDFSIWPGLGQYALNFSPTPSTPCTQSTSEQSSHSSDVIYWSDIVAISPISGLGTVHHVYYPTNSALTCSLNKSMSDYPVDRCSVSAGYNGKVFAATTGHIYAIQKHPLWGYIWVGTASAAGVPFRSNLAVCDYAESGGSTEQYLFATKALSTEYYLSCFNAASFYIDVYGVRSVVSPSWQSEALSMPEEYDSESIITQVNPPAIDADNYVFITACDKLHAFDPFVGNQNPNGFDVAPLFTVTCPDGYFGPPSIHRGGDSTSSYGYTFSVVWDSAHEFSRLVAVGDDIVNDASNPWPPVPNNTGAWMQEGKDVAKSRMGDSVISNPSQFTITDQSSYLQPYGYSTYAEVIVDSSGCLYVSALTGELIKIDPNDPNPAWTYTPALSEPLSYSAAALSPYGDRVYHTYACANYQEGVWLSAIDTSTGTELWSYQIGDIFTYAAPVVRDDETVFIGGVFDESGLHSCKMFAFKRDFDPLTDTPAESSTYTPCDIDIISTCTLGDDNEVYFKYFWGGSSYVSKYTFINDQFTSEMRSPYVSGLDNNHAPVLAANGSIVLCPGPQRIVAFNAADMSFLWERVSALGFHDISFAVDDSGLVYFLNRISQTQTNLVCLNSVTNMTQWYVTFNGFPMSSPLVFQATNNVCIVVGTDSDAYIFDDEDNDGVYQYTALNTGVSFGEFNSPSIGEIDGTPVIVMADYAGVMEWCEF